MKLPCEIIIWYVLPSIRSELVKKLIAKGMAQKEVAELLDVTEATISQYVNKKRGSRIVFKGDADEAIEQLAAALAAGDETVNLTVGMCRICDIVKKDKTVCEIHREYENVPEDCTVCFTIWDQECSS